MKAIHTAAPRWAALGLLLAMLTGCGAKAPDSLAFETDGVLLGGAGETSDLAAMLEVSGGDGAELRYESSDPSVAEVSDAGALTAKGDGSARITVYAQADRNIQAALDVLVFPYRGVYTATKYIDAMGCDVRVRIRLQEDGSYDYYRYPMFVALSGGGQMPSLTDRGSYTAEGSTLHFTGGQLGAFSLEMQIQDECATLSGSVPTGGAPTQVQMLQNTTEDRGESGTYTGQSETSDGTALEYTLTLERGNYTLTARFGQDERELSAGHYSFSGDEMEFAPDTGAAFFAAYSAQRQTVEGMDIPTSSEESAGFTAATLTRSDS